MKKILLLAVFCFSINGVFAQAPLENGGLQLNAGIGTSGWGTPVYIGLDYGLGSNFTLGGELSYRNHDERFNNNWYDSSVTGIGVNANYHFNEILGISRQWDFYAGLGLTYYTWKYRNDAYHGSHDSEVDLGAQIGGRYFFNKKIGINLEAGGGNTINGLKLGITFKL